MRASRLVDIVGAHVDGCLYVGPVSIDFAGRLVDGGARVSVPTTLNVGSVDLQHPQNLSGTDELAGNARTPMSLYARSGVGVEAGTGPAVDHDRRTVDERRLVGDQESHDACHLGRVGDALTGVGR